MSTLREFVAAVKTQGLMPSNRFKVEFSLPGSVLNAPSGTAFKPDLRKVMLYCDTAQLPGMSISTTQARTYGEFREMPYERLFDNINLTFYIDRTMDTKALFDTWINSIQNPASRQLAYYNDYITDMTIYVLDKSDKSQYSVKLYECYPKSIGSIQLDYAAKDVMKLQVSINYRYWTSSSAVESANSSNVVQNGREFLDGNPGAGTLSSQSISNPGLIDLNSNSFNTFRR